MRCNRKSREATVSDAPTKSGLHRVIAPSASSFKSSESRDPPEPLATISVKAQTIYDEKITLSEVLKAESQREMNFSRSTKRTLLTSFMSGSGGVSSHGGGAAEDAEEDFLNVLNIPAFGNFTRMWIDVYFGRKKRSAACELLIDSGKRVMSDIYPLL